MKSIRLATVFSGIGAIEQALEKLNIKYKIVFACDNGNNNKVQIDYKDLLNKTKKLNNSETSKIIKNLYSLTNKTNHVKKSYFENYNIIENQWFEDIRFIKGKEYKNKIDLLVGGSPCQSFSIIGKRAGLTDVRGSLFYDFARLVKESEPNSFIFENVPGMVTHDKGNTWKVIKEVFESLDYKIHFKILNSKDYGIPQNRKRLFVIGFKNKNKKFEFPKEVKLVKNLNDYLEKNIDSKYYLGKKGFEFVTNPKYKNRARINQHIIQTQKANQQFNWNGDFIFEEYSKIKNNKKILERAYIGIWNNQKGVIRKLTNRECLRLMGFSDKFIINVPEVQSYRQAGNSIVVNVLENILKSMYGV